MTAKTVEYLCIRVGGASVLASNPWYALAMIARQYDLRAGYWQFGSSSFPDELVCTYTTSPPADTV